MGLRFLDQYSLLHFATGIVAYFFGISFTNWMIMHTIFELLENTETGMSLINRYVGTLWPGGKPYADAFINSVGDTVATAIGWLVAYWLDEYGSRHGYYPHTHD